MAGVALAMLATVAAPVAARPEHLSFGDPIALTSNAPLREAMSEYYSTGEDRDHEWSGEPVIQVTDDGTIIIAGTCCVVAASPVWYSTDGKTFKETESPGHVREWGIGAEGDLAVDHDGHVYFVDTYVPGMLMSRWSDNGKTWDYTQPVVGVPPGMNDRPWLAWTQDRLYLYMNHLSHTAVYSSADGGRTWDPAMPMQWQGNSSGQPYFPGHIAADEDDSTLWVAGVVEKSSEPTETVLGSAVSTDGGLTFTEAPITKPQRELGFSPIFTGSTAVDDAGNGYVTYSTYDQQGCDVYFASSTDKGKSWNAPVKVSDGIGCATFPWVTAGSDGNIALAWYQTPEAKTATPGQQFLRALTRPSVYGLHLPLAPFQDQVSPEAQWYLHAAAVTKATSARPKIDETRVTTETPILEGPLLRELWDFLQVDIDRAGKIHIAFVDKYRDSAPQTWYVGSVAGPSLR